MTGIPDLPLLEDGIADEDLFQVVDVSDMTGSAAGTDMKATASSLGFGAWTEDTAGAVVTQGSGTVGYTTRIVRWNAIGKTVNATVAIALDDTTAGEAGELIHLDLSAVLPEMRGHDPAVFSTVVGHGVAVIGSDVFTVAVYGESFATVSLGKTGTFAVLGVDETLDDTGNVFELSLTYEAAPVVPTWDLLIGSAHSTSGTWTIDVGAPFSTDVGALAFDCSTQDVLDALETVLGEAPVILVGVADRTPFEDNTPVFRFTITSDATLTLDLSSLVQDDGPGIESLTLV